MAEESDDEIFIKDVPSTPEKGRKRKPRQMSEETKERMALILAKGRETRLKNNQLKREALEQDKQMIKETLKTRLKEVKKQLKEELVNNSLQKKKRQSKQQVPEPMEEDKDMDYVDPEPVRKVKAEPEPGPEVKQPETKTAPEPAKPAPEPAPEPAKPAPVTAKVQQHTPISAPAPAPVQIPAPNVTAEYMKKLRSAYHF